MGLGRRCVRGRLRVKGAGVGAGVWPGDGKEEVRRVTCTGVGYVGLGAKAGR